MAKAGRSYIIRMVSAITAVSAVMMLLGACRSGKTDIPDIPSPDDTAYSESEATDPSHESDPNEHILSTLNVALPYQDSTVRYLAQMYYAKKNNLWDKNYTGSDIDLDQLSSINTDLIITSSRTFEEGVSSSVLSSWKSNNAMPDLFLASDINDAADSGLIVPLNDFTGADPSFDNDRIFANCVLECTRDGKIYGIPHAVSVELLIGNSDFIPSSGRPPVIYTCDEFAEYLNAVKTEYPGTVPIMSASDLFPYIGSAFNHGEKTSYMLNKEYKAQPILIENVFDNEKEFIAALYSEGLSKDKDSNGANPVYSRQCAIWTASSATLKTWEVYYPDNIYTMFLPSYDPDNQAPANVHVYPLCVSSTASNGKLAADFASFISFDTDAQLLIQRCEMRSGFFPVTRSSAVWDIIHEDSAVGQTSYILKQILDNAVFVPADDSDPVFAKTKDYFADFGSREEYSLEELYGN